VELAGSRDTVWRWNTVYEGGAKARATFNETGRPTEESIEGAIEWKTLNKGLRRLGPTDMGNSEGGQIVYSRAKKGIPIYTIAGTQNAKGVRDAGPNSIENNVDYGLRLVAEFLADNLSKDKRQVAIFIKGHSRGAAAAAILSKKVKERYPQVHVETVLFDPVPGPKKLAEGKNRSPEYEKIDLSDVNESTVVYSRKVKKGRLFRPTAVTGAKRVIWSGRRHAVGVSVGVNLNEDGRLYRNSKLNSLDPGVYFAKTTPKDIHEPEVIQKPNDKGELRKEFGKKLGRTRKKLFKDTTEQIVAGK
jgi:hypothetical protein